MPREPGYLPRERSFLNELIVKTERLLEAQDENFSATAGLSFEGSGEKSYQTHSLALTLVIYNDERRLTSSGREESSDENFPGQEEKGCTLHWLPHVFNQSRPATLLEDTGQTSILLGLNMAGSLARLTEDGYKKLIELPFEDGDLLVNIYHRSHDSRSRILCRKVRPSRSQKECTLPLVSLLVERSGPFLKLFEVDASEVNPKLWACLKFSDIEGTFIGHCSLYPWVVALRAAGTAQSSP